MLNLIKTSLKETKLSSTYSRSVSYQTDTYISSVLKGQLLPLRLKMSSKPTKKFAGIGRCMTEEMC